jgi:hypothetical protein
MRSMLVGLSALTLVGSASANAAVSLVGTDVTITYLSPHRHNGVRGSYGSPHHYRPDHIGLPGFRTGRL